MRGFGISVAIIYYCIYLTNAGEYCKIPNVTPAEYQYCKTGCCSGECCPPSSQGFKILFAIATTAIVLAIFVCFAFIACRYCKRQHRYESDDEFIDDQADVYSIGSSTYEPQISTLYTVSHSTPPYDYIQQSVQESQSHSNPTLQAPIEDQLQQLRRSSIYPTSRSTRPPSYTGDPPPPYLGTGSSEIGDSNGCSPDRPPPYSQCEKGVTVSAM